MPGAPATMTEGLQKVLQDLSMTMTAPDADIQFLSQLQGVVVGRMKAGAAGAQQPGGQGGPPAGGGAVPPPQAGPPTGGPPTGPPSQLQGGPTPNGVTPLAQVPNADELRRQLAGNSGA